MSRPIAIDLFCGAAGGWSLGMHRAGFRTMAACEIDPWRRAVFSQNFPDVRMYDDVRTIGADRIISDFGCLPDIIFGSPPCQDASSANTKGNGVDGERTGLFFEAIRIIGECRPRWVALENVPGLRTRGSDRVLCALEEIGYSAWPFVVGADDIGANHRRKRVWIIAFDPAQIGRDGGRAWRCGPHGDSAPYPASSDAADPHENELRIEPRRSGGQSRRSEAEPSGDAFSDAAEIRSERVTRKNEQWPREAAESSARVDANGKGQSHGAVDAEMGGSSRAGEDAGEPWAHWNGGLAYHLRLDDGLSTRVAASRGVAGSIVAAYGDAVVPQITESIGRAIWRVENSLSALQVRAAT